MGGMHRQARLLKINNDDVMTFPFPVLIKKPPSNKWSRRKLANECLAVFIRRWKGIGVEWWKFAMRSASKISRRDEKKREWIDYISKCIVNKHDVIKGGRSEHIILQRNLASAYDIQIDHFHWTLRAAKYTFKNNGWTFSKIFKMINVIIRHTWSDCCAELIKLLTWETRLNRPFRMRTMNMSGQKKQ